MAPPQTLAHTVFVVDDDASVRQALGRLIRADGWDVRIFASGKLFLDAMKREEPGCVVMDIRMPGLTGHDVLDELKACAPHVPVIALSAHEDAATRARAQHAIAFLRKPVADHDLLGTIGSAIARPKRAKFSPES